MNEVKHPKKPLIYYYSIALLILMLINFLAIPWLAERQIKQVDYGTFISMTLDNEIDQVEIQKQDAELVLNRAKIFVTCLMSNYALNASQLEQLRSLCARLNLEVDMETEVKKMERRREQIAHKRRAEWNHLLQLFSC